VLNILIYIFVGANQKFKIDNDTKIAKFCLFDFLSVQPIIAFFLGFGCTGYSCLFQFEFEQVKSFVFASIVGLIFFFVTAGFIFLVRKLEKKIIQDRAKTVTTERIGQAHTSFAPKSKGQVEILINRHFSIVDAMNNSDEEINESDIVEVVEIKNDMLYIEKVG
jgi:membrane-bound ClpP family serine protease